MGKVGKGLHNACRMAGRNKCFVVLVTFIFTWAGSTITKCRFDPYLDLIQNRDFATLFWSLFLVERSWLCYSILSHNNKKFCLRFVVFFSVKEISAQIILEMSVQCQKCFLRTNCFDKMEIVVVENNAMQVVSSAILIFGLISSLHFNCQVNFHFVNRFYATCELWILGQY